MSATSILGLYHATKSDHLGRNRARVLPSLPAILEESFPNLELHFISEINDTLSLLAEFSSQGLLIVIDLDVMPHILADFVRQIRALNPVAEVVVLLYGDTSWNDLPLPAGDRPVLLSRSCDPTCLVSLIVKLNQVVKSKNTGTCPGLGSQTKTCIYRSIAEALLKLLNRQSSVGMISVRRDGFFSSCNSEAERLTGYRMSELTHIEQWSHTVLTQLAQVQSLREAFETIWLEKAGSRSLYLRVKRKDGRSATLVTTLIMWPDALGKARQIVLLFFDPLDSSGAREYEMIMQSSITGIYKYLPGEGFLRVSHGALELINRAFRLELTQRDILNQQVKDLPLPAEIAAQWQGYLERVASQGAGSGEGIPPLGLPRRRMMVHAFATRVADGTGDLFSALAIVMPQESRRSGVQKELSEGMITVDALKSFPSPFLALRAVRDEHERIVDFTCVGINTAGCRLLGIQPDMNGDLYLNQVLPNDELLNAVFGYAVETAETGVPASFEWSQMLESEREDETGTLLLHIWMGRSNDGVVMFLDDVTTSRRDQGLLRHLLPVFYHMQEALVITDMDGRIIEWNPASERIFGYPRSAVLGRKCSILVKPGKGGRSERGSREVFRDGDVWKSEFEFVRQDGSIGVAFGVFTLLRDEIGQPIGSVGLHHDLSRWKRLEEQLTARSQELQEKNMALNALLLHAEAERTKACEKVASAITRKVTKRIYRIMDEAGKPEQVELEVNQLLDDLGRAPRKEKVDPDDPQFRLSKKELEVARLIRLGKTTDEAAFILGKSANTIRLQRISIRKKLGLSGRNLNLAGYLRNLDLT